MITVGNNLGLLKCSDAIDNMKSPSLVVIDKSGSSPPTLEHHLAMHLWMGWLGLYTLCIFPAMGAAVLFSLLTFHRAQLPVPLPSTNMTNGCNSSAAFSPEDSICYTSYGNFSSPYSTPSTLPMSPQHPFSIILDLAIYSIQWIATCCSGITFLAIIISVIAPLHKHGSPNPKWCVSIGHWIMDRGAEYFKLKVVLEDFEAMKKSAESGRPAIFVLEPHDVLPVSIFSLCDYLQALPGKRRLIGCISSACFRVPLMRHVWSWVCAESIDRTNVVRLLKDGVSVCLCPGGVKEVIYMAQQQQKKQNKIIKNLPHGDFSVKRKSVNPKPSDSHSTTISVTSISSEDSSSHTMKEHSMESVEEHSEAQSYKDKNIVTDNCALNQLGVTENESECEGAVEGLEQEECVLYLRGRKGFVRLALQHRCPLVPMFTFGQRDVLVPWFCTNR